MQRKQINKSLIDSLTKAYSQTYPLSNHNPTNVGKMDLFDRYALSFHSLKNLSVSEAAKRLKVRTMDLHLTLAQNVFLIEVLKLLPENCKISSYWNIGPKDESQEKFLDYLRLLQVNPDIKNSQAESLLSLKENDVYFWHEKYQQVIWEIIISARKAPASIEQIVALETSIRSKYLNYVPQPRILPSNTFFGPNWKKSKSSKKRSYGTLESANELLNKMNKPNNPSQIWTTPGTEVIQQNPTDELLSLPDNLVIAVKNDLYIRNALSDICMEKTKSSMVSNK